MKIFQKGFVSPLFLAIFAISFIVSATLLYRGGAYVYVQNKQANQPVVASNQATTTAQTADWKTYRNDQLGIEFKYPGDLFSTPQLISSKGRVMSNINDLNDQPSDGESLATLQLCYLGADKDCNKKEGEIFNGGLVMGFNNENSGYTTYQHQLSIYSADANYSKITIGGTDAYKRNNGPRNEVVLIKLKQPYFAHLQMNAFKDTCASSNVECGLIEVENGETKVLYEQILSTFKFTDVTDPIVGIVCGAGIMGGRDSCPTGYICKFPPSHSPGADDGACVKN